MGRSKKHWSKEAHERHLARLKKAIIENGPDTSEIRKRNLNRITDDLPRY